MAYGPWEARPEDELAKVQKLLAEMIKSQEQMLDGGKGSRA